MAVYGGIGFRRDPGLLPEHFDEIADVAEAGPSGDFRNAESGGFQQGRRFGQAIFQQILRDRHVHHPSEIAAAFASAHGYAFRQRRKRKFLRIMLMKISHQLQDPAGIGRRPHRFRGRKRGREQRPYILQNMLGL